VFGEVFHEMLATLDAGTATSLAPGSWNSRHPDAAPYFVEFAPLLRPEGGVAGYSEDMAFERYFPKDGRLSEQELSYIQSLLKHCREVGRAPVFSCTRTLGRMKHLKDAFGGKHILLTRDPFQQWCSYTEQAANGNPYFLATNEMILKSALDAGWLNLGNPDSATDFLSLQAMQKHLILHLKIYSEIASAADVIVNYELLDSQEYRNQVSELISTKCGIAPDFSDFRGSNQFSLVELPSQRVLEETLMPFLPASGSMHPEVVSLYDAMRISIRSYSGQTGELVQFTRRKLHELAQANEQLQVVCDERRAASAELETRLHEATRDREAASRRTSEAHRREADAAAKLAEAAQHYADQIQSLSTEHGAAQDDLRRELTRMSDDLREKLRESQASGSAARTALARMEERTANLESTVARLTSELQSNSEASEKAVADCSRELHETLAELGRADTLIRAAREERSSRWDLIGQIFGLSARPQSWRALLSWQLHAAHQASSLSQHKSQIHGKEQIMNTAGSAESRNPYLRANSLAELLAWDDVDFVRCAYVTVLGRQPDRMGEAHFTNRIRMGDSKYAILWQLRRSDEALSHDPGIAGFDRALKREARRRNRLFGWLVRLALPGEGTSRQDRRFRQLRNMLAIIGDQSSSETTVAIGTLGSELAVSLEKIAGSLAQLSEHVVASNGRTVEEGPASPNPAQVIEQARVTDDLDLSSRERAVLRAIQSASY
jgi:hypothetical protein